MTMLKYGRTLFSPRKIRGGARIWIAISCPYTTIFLNKESR